MNERFDILKETSYYRSLHQYINIFRDVTILTYFDGEIKCILEVPNSSKETVNYSVIQDLFVSKKFDIEDAPEWFKELYRKAIEIDHELYTIKRVFNKTDDLPSEITKSDMKN